MKDKSLREKFPYFDFFWSECGKIRTRKTPNTNTFHAVSVLKTIRKFNFISTINFKTSISPDKFIICFYDDVREKKSFSSFVKVKKSNCNSVNQSKQLKITKT